MLHMLCTSSQRHEFVEGKKSKGNEVYMIILVSIKLFFAECRYYIHRIATISFVQVQDITCP